MQNISTKTARSFVLYNTRDGRIYSIAIICIAITFLTIPIDPLSSCIIGLVCCLASLITLKLYDWPLTFVLRMIVLGVPSIVTGIIIIIYGTKNVVMPHAARHIYESYEVTSRILLTTALALSSSAIAWFTAVRKPWKLKVRLPGEASLLRFWLYATLAVVAGTLTANSLGPYVWIAEYASASQGTFLKIGNLPTIAVIGVLGMYGMLLSDKVIDKVKLRFFCVITLYTLINCMFLRGMRLEVFAVIIAIYAGYFLKHNLKIKPLRFAITLIGFYIFSQIFGALRAMQGTDLTLQDTVMSAFNIIQYDGSSINFSLGTLADIASTFYNTVGLYDDGIISPLWGGSYLDYIPRTLPEFLSPERPKDLSGVFENVGLTSGGGFFELAEAYINFGFLGCILVPFIITYLIAQCHVIAYRYRYFTSLMLYMFVIELFLRGIWYQTFAFYKSIITWLLVELLIIFIVRSRRTLTSSRCVPND